jgi:hypothetical protein
MAVMILSLSGVGSVATREIPNAAVEKIVRVLLLLLVQFTKNLRASKNKVKIGPQLQKPKKY